MVHGNYYDKYRSKNVITRVLTGGFLSGWRSLIGEVSRLSTPVSLLEVGCGDGYLLNFTRSELGGAGVTAGLEPGMIAIRRKQGLTGNFQPVCGSIYALPFDDNSFDLVTVPEVFEHLEDPEAGLREVVRVSRKWVAASVPWEPVWRMANLVRGNYWKRFGNTPGHIQHFSRRGFIDFAGKYLSIQQVRSPFPWTMLLGTIRTKASAVAEVAEAVHRNPNQIHS